MRVKERGRQIVDFSSLRSRIEAIKWLFDKSLHFSPSIAPKRRSPCFTTTKLPKFTSFLLIFTCSERWFRIVHYFD